MKLTKYLHLKDGVVEGSVSDQKISSKTVRKAHEERLESEPFVLTSDSVEEWVLMAKNGDADAFGEIYDHYVDQIFKYVYYRVPQGEAEDMVETVFMKAWEKLYQYKPKQNGFGAWLFRIAHNLIVDMYRGRKDKEFLELSDDTPEYRREHNPVKMTEDGLHSEKLRLAISKLNKSHRQIIILKFINELSNDEISNILKKNEGNIRILQFRALKELKNHLEEAGLDFV